MLQDRFRRTHNYLRLSLTNNCNLRCAYCMPEEDYVHTPSTALMQAPEILSLANTFVSLGVDKIRLTGGEPLVRRDAADIILQLSQLPVSLTMTTNGTRVHQFLPVLKAAGIRSINVSLDTLQRDKYQLLTRRDALPLVTTNLQRLLDAGIPVKVNMVVMKGFNDHEVFDFVEWAGRLQVQLRFIEFMPFAGNQWQSKKVFTQAQLLERLGQRYALHPVAGAPHDTARHYCIPGHAASIALISSMSAPFCSTCNRLRLTADGKLKSCLFAAEETDLLTALRSGADVETLIHHNLQRKFETRGGQFQQGFEAVEHLVNRSMINIGG